MAVCSSPLSSSSNGDIVRLVGWLVGSELEKLETEAKLAEEEMKLHEAKGLEEERKRREEKRAAARELVKNVSATFLR